MGWSIRELADAAGVSKQTVTNRLKRAKLWDMYATKGPDGSVTVSDEAAQRVLSLYPAKRRLPSTGDDEDRSEASEAEQLLRAQVEQLEARVADQGRELERLRSQNERLSDEIVNQAKAISALPAPDAVERAREDGERAGRDAGEESGRELERQKIADMGLLARRRYLRGLRHL